MIDPNTGKKATGARYKELMLRQAATLARHDRAAEEYAAKTGDAVTGMFAEAWRFRKSDDRAVAIKIDGEWRSF